MLNVPVPASGLVPAETLAKGMPPHGRLGWTCPECWNSNAPEARSCVTCGPQRPAVAPHVDL